MLDKVVTSTELKYTDRLGGEHYTVDGIKAEGDKVVEETRQNLIPLSRQYMTLAAAQADIANIPDGSATYYRSPDDSALAIEVINNGGTLEPTGRKMPSQEYVEERTGAILNSIRIYSSQAAAQADVDAGYIEDGNFCYARTESDASIASELQNEAGVLVATGRVIPAKTAIDDAIAPYSPLLPLTKTSEFFETGVSGNEYESVTDEDITFDENKNILRCIRDGKQM
ncbi:hypothetical protein ACNPIP_20695, partial [Klebsiella pneumoniae]